MVTRFSNQTLMKSEPPKFFDMQTVHDLAQAGAGSARFYPGYYGNGYPMRPGWGSALADIFVGLILLGITITVIYWVIAFFAVMQRKMYYGYKRKRRNVGGDDDDEGDAIDALLGVSRVAESWRHGNPKFMRMLKEPTNDHITANMTARITSAIENKTVEFEDV